MSTDRNARRARIRKFRVYTIGTIMLIGFVLLVFYRYIFVTILPGHVGVLYSWLLGGTRVEQVYGEGLALKLPWNRIYVMETRVRRSDDTVLALSAESMELTVELSTLYRVYPQQAGRLLQEIGPDYADRVVRPLAVGAVREAISRYDSTELYTNDFSHLEEDVRKHMLGSPYAHLIDFQRVIVREINLPTVIIEAVQEKLAHEQRAAAYVFRIEQERQEAERRRIEAIGIQNFYAVVSGALTESLLTWRGIEATVELARSPNSKVVVVGGGKDQLPLILGSDIHNLPPAQAVQGMSADQAPSLDWDQLPRLFPENSSRGLSAGNPQEPEVPAQPDSGASPDDAQSARPAESPATQPPPDTRSPDDRAAANDPDASDHGLTPLADDEGLRGARPDFGFRRLPRELEAPQKTRAPYGAESE